jgi:hypothetical protein
MYDSGLDHNHDQQAHVAKGGLFNVLVSSSERDYIGIENIVKDGQENSALGA